MAIFALIVFVCAGGLICLGPVNAIAQQNLHRQMDSAGRRISGDGGRCNSGCMN